MKATLLIPLLVVSSTALADTVNFDDAKTGSPPTGWTATQTGRGSAKWSVEKDDTAPSKLNVLKQGGEATSRSASRMIPSSKTASWK
jgi:hypothetical protein